MEAPIEIPGTAEIPLSDQEFQRFRSLVHKQTGVALKETKAALLKSRLLKRLRHYGYATFEQYYEHIEKRDACGQELQEMINAVTTHKTSFFREPHHFDILAEHLLEPAHQASLRGHPPSIRIWSAGCSSGEEPYSIAITAAMNIDRLSAWDIKILATDIDTDVLEQARTGVYARESVSDISRDALKRCFLSGAGAYANSVRLKPAVRDLVTFAHLNLMHENWPFRGKFDAIFCRNVIIYFDQHTQRRVVERMVQHLKTGGLFFAGHSENLFWLGHLLEPIGHTVYRLTLANSASGRGLERK